MKGMMRTRLGGKKGFTLIEIIGVLAVISILAAILAPKVFEVIAEAKSTRASAEIQVYSAAVAKWYKDVGSLVPLNSTSGAPNAVDDDAWHNQLISNGGVTLLGWGKWLGPYIDGTPVASVGDVATIRNHDGSATVPAVSNDTFDLNGDGASNTGAGTRVIYLHLTGVTSLDFNRVENVLDSGVGGTANTSGRVKWNTGTNVMRIYLAHN